MRAFPLLKDLVTDVSWNYRVAAKIPPLQPRAEVAGKPFQMQQIDVDRIQEFRKCIECFLCQDVCHVLREHDRKDAFFGPRQMVRIAALEMHPLDDLNRRQQLKGEGGVGMCNITKCCTEVCPEHIHITDNAIIPLTRARGRRLLRPDQRTLALHWHLEEGHEKALQQRPQRANHRRYSNRPRR